MNQIATTEKKQRPIDVFRAGLDLMDVDVKSCLPAHIPVERFKRVVLTAVTGSSDLLAADRQSLYRACMRAAQDGLLPDGREGALVIFNTKVKVNGVESWIKQVQWLPMAYGLIKKMRNSGEVSSVIAHPVYENDKFAYVLGDDERIEHEPTLGERGPFKLVYSIVTLKDGSKVREVMTKADVDKVREASKSKDSPAWKNWYDEMSRAKVLHRIAKWCPMSSEVDSLLRRVEAEEALTNQRGGRDVTIDAPATEVETPPQVGRRSQLDDFEDAPAHDPETGEIVSNRADLAAAQSALDAATTVAEVEAVWESLSHEICNELGWPAHEDAIARVTGTNEEAA